MDTYVSFFETATGRSPLPYQVRVNAFPAPYLVISVPTGLGKTDAALIDWIARRPTTRLAWCLPGRALTGQITAVARDRVARLGAGIRVVELMGGSDDLDLTLRPDEPAILVGTQDILISRALNRGYARSPFRWPIDFALLNNDTHWIFDEVQLLGDAVATSTQLAAFRQRFGVFGEVPCTWISATLDPRWLRTVDFRNQRVEVVELDAEDLKHGIVARRISAAKSLHPAPASCRLPRGCAEFVAGKHQNRTLTLVVTNTVDRAREIWSELHRIGQDAILLHSRFRPADRVEHLAAVLDRAAGIVVSTQVIEAGIDLDADLLVTDVAPWTSLVQRFGRVNRYGDRHDSRIFWVDRPLTNNRKSLATGDLKPKDLEAVSAPYETNEIEEAREQLHVIASASPTNLPKVTGEPPFDFVLRRADILDLFDTTPDLAGNHIDVSRFVRSGKEHDVYLAWREWPDADPSGRAVKLHDDELCPVPLTDAREFLKTRQCWTWEHTRLGGWRAVEAKSIYPGLRLLVRSTDGGYDPSAGWLPASVATVTDLQCVAAHDLETEEAHDDDPRSLGSRQTVAEHTSRVVTAVEQYLASMSHLHLAPYVSALRTATRKHDWGKAHPVFQQTVHNLSDPPDNAPAEILAKQSPGLTRSRHSRSWFRHELGSALAMLEAGDSDLSAYLAAAHHGKVRVNIRSMPGEADGRSPDNRVARGIVDPGDWLFAVDLGGGIAPAETRLSLAVMDLGTQAPGVAGWSDRSLRLLDEVGPFRLAFLEMVLRAADERASADHQEAR